MALHAAVARLEVTFVNAINVNNNKMVFCADNSVLIKLLKQQKEHDAKKFIAKFSSKPRTLSGLNKLFVRLLNTGHFTF